SIARVDQSADALRRNGIEFSSNEHTVALFGTATDSPTKLVQLREPESLRLLDHNHCRVRNVHADLDYSGRDQDLRLSALETIHRSLFVVRGHFAVQQPNGDIWKHNLRQMLVHLLGRLHRLRFAFLDDRIDHVSLTSECDLLCEKAVYLFDTSIF